MKSLLFLFIVFLTLKTDLIAAEAGMPQLDPKYWASQAFWLAITFLALYLAISKIFIPKIENNIDSRENKIRKGLEEAKTDVSRTSGPIDLHIVFFYPNKLVLHIAFLRPS